MSQGEVRPASKTGARGEVLEWLQSVSPEKENVPVTNTTLPQKRPRHEENEFVKGARIGSADTADEIEPEKRRNMSTLNHLMWNQIDKESRKAGKNILRT